MIPETAVRTDNSSGISVANRNDDKSKSVARLSMTRGYHLNNATRDDAKLNTTQHSKHRSKSKRKIKLNIDKTW
jgi:hypothetical protein